MNSSVAYPTAESPSPQPPQFPARHPSTGATSDRGERLHPCATRCRQCWGYLPGVAKTNKAMNAMLMK
jgi:hypothetical protein